MTNITVQLFIKGVFWDAEPVQLIEYDYSQAHTEEDRQQIFEVVEEHREKTIRDTFAVLRIRFLKDIIKHNQEYSFQLAAESKMNFTSLLDDTE